MPDPAARYDLDGSGIAGSDGGTGIAILGGSSLTIYGQAGQSGELKVIGGNGGSGANGGSGGSGGIGDSGASGGIGGDGGSAITGSAAIYGGSVIGTGGSGGQGGGSNGMGRSSSGEDGTAINGTVSFADGYVHLTRAGSDEDTIKAMEWTGGSNSFPQGEKWVKIQPMRVNGVTVTPAVSTIKPGGTVNLAARITVLNPTGVGPLNVTKGAAWTVTGGKSYTVSDGKFTVKADETAKSLTVNAKYGTDTGSASVTVEQTAPQE